MVPRQLRARPDQERLGAAPQLHRVVGHQPMAADDEVERTFALPDPAFTDDEDAEAEDVHQDAVNRAARREIRVEDRREPRHRFGCGGAGAEEGHARAVRLDGGLRRRVEIVRHHEARQLMLEHAAQHGGALVRAERFEVAHFAFAEDEHASVAQVRVEPR